MNCRLVSALVVLCTACTTTYQQPTDLSWDQQAVIVPPKRHFGNAVLVAAVDGLPLRPPFMLPRSGPVVVKPGKHVLRISVGNGLSGGAVEVWLVAEPGETYRIEEEINGMKFRVWLVDERTGATVGGLKGGADEPRI